MPRARATRRPKSTGSLRQRVNELERERELLNAIANYAPSLICLVDEEGRVRPYASNRAFERTLGYEPHVHARGEEARLVREGARARRWVVESTFAWLVLFRRLKISHERLAATRNAFLSLACALVTWRASHPVTRAEAAY
jgi:transposase